MMARSNPHSSMPSPARSPLGKDGNEDDHEDDDGEEDERPRR